MLAEEILGEGIWEICCIYSPGGAVLEKPTGQPSGLNEHSAQELGFHFATHQAIDGLLSEWIKTIIFVSSLLQPLGT